MNKNTPIYFPSLYDRSVSTSPLNDFNIWKNFFLPLKGHHQPQSLAVESSPWPPGLAKILYEPLQFFSASLRADFTPEASHLDEMCELEIKIKELELLTITGDGFDSKQYKFLKALKDEKMQNGPRMRHLKNMTLPC
ncbi:uncharacterized protein C11orf91 homolog [Microcaecilia unicolor]|uniref:Uncharacterized protein C11orf91 homolog n=1 Tax=Microcaecilia unicolor TaxID=1415580 RepID=A0A6P7XQB9_9AMPH|nr:uncharacterized protein C11orf91 homolog [Microcaecilia unicolor]